MRVDEITLEWIWELHREALIEHGSAVVERPRFSILLSGALLKRSIRGTVKPIPPLGEHIEERARAHGEPA